MAATAKPQSAIQQENVGVAQASMDAFSSSIDRIMKEIQQKNAEIQTLTDALKSAYSKLTTLGLFAPKVKKMTKGPKIVSGVQRFYLLPDGTKKPIGPGRPPTNAKIVEG